MITTRFGSEVKLLAPVNWSTGWVQVRIDYEDGNKTQFREVHLSDLKADGGINEIQVISDAVEKNLCHDCWRPMEAHQQGKHTIVTCKHADCTLYGVTLSTEQYNRLTAEQFDSYRKMVIVTKERNNRGK